MAVYRPVWSAGPDHGRHHQPQTGPKLVLHESEEKYRSLVKFAPAAIYEMDLQGTKFLSVNEVMCNILGYSREELLGIKPVDLLDEESRLLFALRMQKKLAGDQSLEAAEYRIRRKDGAWIYADINVGSFTFADNKPARVVVIGHDITERKRMEEALLNKNAELNALNEELTLREEEMGKALTEKEILLSEIHHRVKNNLAAFISLLSLGGSTEETRQDASSKKISRTGRGAWPSFTRPCTGPSSFRPSRWIYTSPPWSIRLLLHTVHHNPSGPSLRPRELPSISSGQLLPA